MTRDKLSKTGDRTEKREFHKELLGLAIPIGLQSLLVALIGASDALMLGRLTQDAVSAVSLANQIAFIMNLFIGAVTGGGGALLAQYWGKGDRQMVKNLFCMLLKWSFGISFVFFALTMFAPEQLMYIYTKDAALIEIGASYLRIVGVSYLFSGVTQCYYLVMKLEGKAAKSVMISVVTLTTDVVVDFFLIYGIAGVPKLGANGSAWSTIAVEAIALIWCMAESYRKESIHPDWQSFKWFSAAITKDMFKISLPMLSPQIFFLLITITINSFKVFDSIRILTNGLCDTNVLVFLIYNMNKTSGQAGMAAAAGTVLLIILMIFTIFYFRALGKRVHYQ